MAGRLMFIAVIINWLLLLVVPVRGQEQGCPVNINFSSRDLSNWSVRTGLVNSSSRSYPAPNTGVSSIPEYGLSTTGIQVLSTAGTDKYGSFSVVPTINGYSYGYSIKLGSDATSWDLGSDSRNPGGFMRAVTYTVNVPAGSSSDPYTMTYAYALVLENGTHNSNNQPLFKATVRGSNGIITCASPSYYLPTLDNATGGNGQTPTGATLDSAKAIAQGFSLSPTLFFSHAGQDRNNGAWLQDVWTKPWTEVTFDLAAYRGQQVTLTFEADNCTPGAHFAYAYVALRNECGGLKISGFDEACSNTNTVYSIPALANSVYTWTVPSGWTILSGGNTNIITVKPGNTGGAITVREVNSCADLKDTITVTTKLPTIAGNLSGDDIVCGGINSSLLSLSGQRGNILMWVSSTDGSTWDSVANTTSQYTTQNLNNTTFYKAVVQNGNGCSRDTSTAALITVNPQSNGGVLSPANSAVCAGQTLNSDIMLVGSTGQVLNWQYSYDSLSWSGFSPLIDTTYNVNTINRTTYYRTIVKSGVCPADTSTVAKVGFVNVPFPQASIDPGNASICYGTSTTFNATITNGTHYTWNNTGTLANTGNGTLASLPFSLQPTAAPQQTTSYILSVMNEGCPNVLTDTFHVNVTQPITVFAGNDTFITASQPLQFNISVSDSLANQYTWLPGTGLNNTSIANPVADLWNMAGKTITYTVRAATAEGCLGEDDIKVMVFTTAPDFFIPSAFSPNGDGLNDVLRPVGAGIAKIDFFHIYNRWGQLVFKGKDAENGWDGTVNGRVQTTGSFVYVVQGVDFTGKTIVKKGLVTIIQ